MGQSIDAIPRRRQRCKVRGRQRVVVPHYIFAGGIWEEARPLYRRRMVGIRSCSHLARLLGKGVMRLNTRQHREDDQLMRLSSRQGENCIHSVPYTKSGINHIFIIRQCTIYGQNTGLLICYFYRKYFLYGKEEYS